MTIETMSKKQKFEVNWLGVALIAFLVVAGATQSFRLQAAKQDLRLLQTSELHLFDPLCAEHEMGYRYITNGDEVKCYNETTTVFYRVKLEETRRIE